MRIGKLRHRVMVQRPVRTITDSGAESATSWTTVSTTWANIDAGRPSERVVEDVLLAAFDVLIKMRWAPVLRNMDATWRIVKVGGKVYNIVGVTNVEERCEEIVLPCTTGKNSG